MHCFLSKFVSDNGTCNNRVSDVCAENAVCIETENSFYCDCVFGYTGNGCNCTGTVDNNLKYDFCNATEN